MPQLVTFTETETVQEAEFSDKVSQRVKLDALRFASAVADEAGNIPVYEATLIGYFRTFFTLATVDGVDMKDLHKRVRTSKDPRKEIVKVLEEMGWEEDWDSMMAAHREVFKNSDPESEDNKQNFKIGETGSSTQTESQSASES
jgi:hypothetical protein